MKMKLSEIRVRNQNLMQLANKKLPNKLAYGIAKNLMKLQPEAELIENHRMSLVKTYAKRDENDSLITKPNGTYDLGENLETFNKEFDEFLETETEVDIHVVPRETLDLLDDARYDILTPANLVTLDFMIEQPEESEKTE